LTRSRIKGFKNTGSLSQCMWSYIQYNTTEHLYDRGEGDTGRVAQIWEGLVVWSR